MIKIENVDVNGWEAAIRGMRNPMNSWDKSDSGWMMEEDDDECSIDFVIGENDHDLMTRLAAGGSVHAKYRRMITVSLDITAPLYWWKEFDTYKVGTVANSCSTMHKIHAKEFTPDDFSHEHLYGIDEHAVTLSFDSKHPPKPFDSSSMGCLEITIAMLNYNRAKYLETKTKPMKDEQARRELMKKYWWNMIQLLPSSYNQKRTVLLNYEVLVGIYKWRENHKLDEWREFCKWITSLPYSEIITG